MDLSYTSVWHEGQPDIGLVKGKYQLVFGGPIPDWFPNVDWALPEVFRFEYGSVAVTRLEIRPTADEAVAWIDVEGGNPVPVVAIAVIAGAIAAAFCFGWLSIKEVRKSVPLTLGMGAFGIGVVALVFFLKR